jgi:UDP-glucose:(heptosyl)LPS alpha-1,3-glucosyltransferase
VDRLKTAAIVCRNLKGLTGTINTIYRHTDFLVRHGWDVHLFAERLDSSRVKIAGGIPHSLPRWPLGRTWRWRFFSTFFDWKIKSFPGSIVHGHGEVLNQDILSLHNSVHAAYEAIHGRPLAQKDEKGVFYFHRRLLSQGRFKLIIANSQLMKADLMARYSIPSSKIRVIYPGYDPRQFSPSARASARQELRRSMGVTSEEILIGLVTSGDFVKRGVKTFVSTIASLPANTRKRMKALIVGREKRVDVLREECRRLGIADRVIFKESIPDVQNYYYAMDLMVYPAFFEEFGQVVQEAAACGVPVLTSKMVGASELFQGLAKSYLPDRAVADEFAKRLDELIAHPDRLKPWGEAARNPCNRTRGTATAS